MSPKGRSLVLLLAYAGSAILGGVGAVLRGPRWVRVIAGLAAALVLGAAIAVLVHRSTPAPNPVGTQAPNRQRPPLEPPKEGQAARSTADYDPAAPEPPAQIPRLSPTAPWLAAPPTPILVEVAVDEARSRRQRITPAGGQLSVSTPDGTRITLALPPDALVRSQEVTIALVSAVSGLPFGGALVAAVRVTPDDFPLRVPATLTFEPRGGFAPGQELAGFAIRDGRELHLSRADRIEDAKARGRGRVELPLARLGSYGVARATPDEVAAVARRVPSGYIARLEQLIAQAFPPVNQAPGQASRWSLLPVAHAQEAPAPLPEWLSNLFRAFEESFEQVIVPQFKAIPERGCESATTSAALAMYYEWATLPTLLFPVERAGTPWDLYFRLVNQRVDLLRARGYTLEQIDEIDAAMDAFRKQQIFDLVKRGNPLVEDAYRRLFAKMYECCLGERPMQYHVVTMFEAMRNAQLLGVTQLDPDQNAKIDECSCSINAAMRGGAEIWTGTITHEEDYYAEKVQTPGGTRTKKETLQFNYNMEVVIRWPADRDSLLASYTVDGRKFHHAETTDRYSCGNVTSGRDVAGSARDDGATVVIVAAQPGQPGKYRIGYPTAGASGSGTWTSHWSAKGCQIFKPVRDKTGFAVIDTVGYPQQVWVEAQVDPARPFQLSNSEVLEVRDDLFDTLHRPKVTWNLHRCGK